MAFPALLKFGLKEFAVGKPLGIQYPTIYVIMQYFHLAVILGIEDERLVVVFWIMLHCRPYNTCAGCDHYGADYSPALLSRNTPYSPFFMMF